MDDLNSISPSHTYKPKGGVLAWNVISLGLMVTIFSILIFLFVWIISLFAQADSRMDAFMLFLVCIFTPAVILIIFNSIYMIVSVIMSFFSYIKTSPDGIEFRNSPYLHIRCNWSDVDKLGKQLFFIDSIYLKTYEVVGMSLSLKTPLRLLRPKQGFIPIKGYTGWPDGQLKNDLLKYAPDLFMDQQIAQESQPENIESNKGDTMKETPSINQESRLLAAISHASIIFSNFGFIVPIIIYMTQKKTSSFLRFQSLQAFIWQIAMFIFNMFIGLCMTGLIVIPVVFASLPENDALLRVSSDSFFIVIMISALLMICANFVFVIYGIVGAVMAFQGKDFRYILIGNLIEKNMGGTLTDSA